MRFPIAPSSPPSGKPIGSNGRPIPSAPPSPTIAPGEPSKARRERLKQYEKPPIELSNLCPIDRYYTSADLVLSQFKAHLAKGELDDAFVIGRRFALFSTISLPNHDYYTSPNTRLVQLRIKNQKDALWVTRGLERIVEVMDKEEIEKCQREAERLVKEKEEKEREQLEWEKLMKRRLGSRDSSSSFKLDMNDDTAFDVTSKLELLNLAFPKEDEQHISNESLLPPLPPLPIAPPQQIDALSISSSAVQQLKSNGATPMFPEESPPAYNDLFLESLRTATTNTTSISATDEAELANLNTLPTKPKPIPRIPIRTMQRNCERHVQSLRNSKQIETYKLGTYQGRLSTSGPKYDSTNGCAVISPLVVATHIATSNKEYGISNSAINDIIDKRAPPILSKVRSKLGLSQHALIIPSDVHDYLVDEHLLPQSNFVGVCGGDILNDVHMGKLLSMLVNGKDDDNRPREVMINGPPNEHRPQKVGAALFFLEHVISIIQIPLRNGACYYDVIDSLPSSSVGGMATRTRCKDLGALEALLQWYACSKFKDSHCNFIDDNDWNEGICDFDPRTFQGFVWCGGGNTL